MKNIFRLLFVLATSTVISVTPLTAGIVDAHNGIAIHNNSDQDITITVFQLERTGLRTKQIGNRPLVIKAKTTTKIDGTLNYLDGSAKKADGTAAGVKTNKVVNALRATHIWLS